VEILLNSLKNIDSVNTDMFEKVELINEPALINEYDIRNVLSVTEIFDAEREANEIYRIYGKIEYMSLLNKLKLQYNKFEDFFLPQTGNCKNILNSFDFYLVKAGTGYTQIISGGSTILWTRYFEVIATPNEFDIYPIGFSNNVYGEQTYAFNLNIDINVANFLDDFKFPATELFLYAQYKPTIIPSLIEILFGTIWSPFGIPNQFSFDPISLNIGDYVKSFFDVKIGDLIEYSKSNFLQIQHTPQTFRIQTPYNDGRLIWKYNPFIPFRLRYFANELNKENISGTSYEQTSSIPYYATEYPVGTGNYVWRNILPQGYIDPLTGIGVDYPFVNKKRYLFSNIVFDLIPDLNDSQTLEAFKEIWFSRYSTKISVTPMGDINNIGKPCQ
jgi:hypothetical protein